MDDMRLRLKTKGEIKVNVNAVCKCLREKYADNEPIFMSEISILVKDEALVKRAMKLLLDEGSLKRYDKGIYYFPRKSIFRSGSTLNIYDVIKKKYLVNNNKRCGYVSGLLLANQLGLTTQLPSVYEVYSNLATTDFRNRMIAGYRIILRKPRVPVTDDNVDILRLLDLLKDVVTISELNDEDLRNQLFKYLNKKRIDVNKMKQYLPNYPERIYKNMYKVGLLNVIFAQRI